MQNKDASAAKGSAAPGTDEPQELDAYDYELPESAIAQTPVRPRDHARLLVVDGRAPGGPLHHARVYELPRYLRQKDLLVFNDTRVLPCRLRAQRQPSGGLLEVLLLHQRRDGTWHCLTRPARKAPVGQKLAFDGGWTAEVTEEGPFGERSLRFAPGVPVLKLMESAGELPVPPYIQGQPERPDWYQTVYARQAKGERIEGSAAAPTAGLHFTETLMKRLDDMGVGLAFVTLHVGLGTFQPIRSQRIDEHELHREYRVVPEETAERVNEVRRRGGRVIAVGTTVVRTLESAVEEDGHLAPAAGWTDLYIRPGYRFRVVDGLMTNFHLPKSSLLVMVATLMGRERMLDAYRKAVDGGYRFYSYGDASLLLPDGVESVGKGEGP